MKFYLPCVICYACCLWHASMKVTAYNDILIIKRANDKLLFFFSATLDDHTYLASINRPKF